jgi:hypothetical protein
MTMALTDIATTAISRIAGRLARRIVGWSLVGIFGLAALYQASVAAVVALEAEFGSVYAHLIVAGCYALVAIAVVAILWVTVPRPFAAQDRASLAKLPIEAQIATIVEALLLGYAMSRKK